jgi:uncharacterized protein
MSRQALLERSMVIAAPVAAVYDFHLDPRNAGRIAPPGTRVAVEGDVPLRPGNLVTMRIRRRPLPVALTWTVRIESVETGRRIVDVAERSPFALWRHEHLFRGLGDGRTLLTDRVTYRLRGGRLGELLDRAFVRRLLDRDVAERQRRTREALEG